MTDNTILSMLKLNLQITSTALDSYLSSIITTSKEFIKREGITLQNNEEDGQIIIMYSAYLFRSRKDGAAMPRMLRYTLNNRLISEKAKTT